MITLIDLCCSRGEQAWARYAAENGMDYAQWTLEDLSTEAGQKEVLHRIAEASRQGAALVLYSDHMLSETMERFYRQLPEGAGIWLVPVGQDALLARRGNVSAPALSAFQTYITYGGAENIRRAVGYLRAAVLADPQAPEPEPPEKIPFSGIYSIRDERLYPDLQTYLSREEQGYSAYAGIISHRHAWMNHLLSEEKKIGEALHRHGIGVIPVFATGEKNEEAGSLDAEGIIRRYFSRDGVPMIDCLIDLHVHLLRGGAGKSTAERSVECFTGLNIPVLHPLCGFSLSREVWRTSPSPLASTLQSTYLVPEMSGLIEQMLVSLRDMDRGGEEVLEPELELFAARAARWIALRRKPNSQKRVAVMLHNAVCSGVEATIGKAYGLDAFESTVHLLRRLKQEGYSVEHIPENGEALRRLILDKKAISDFRWTSVEDIVESGGALYRMSPAEYEALTADFTPQMREQLTASWGAVPGEGMVYDGKIVITGLLFGNVLVMVQPKRGCYGAKCTGEVCRILHDPHCPPTYQYIAAYRYLERVWKADAVIDLGTDGSLEYLPGKSTGLSCSCWPVAVLGTMPHLYPYHLGVISEASVAKRRSNAVLVGYYPTASVGVSQESAVLMDLLHEFTVAVSSKNGQEAVLEQKLRAELEKFPALRKLFRTAASPEAGAQLVRDSLLQCAEGGKLSGRHVFGENPDKEERMRYLTELLSTEEAFPRQAEENPFQYQQRIRQQIDWCLAHRAENPLASQVGEMEDLLLKTAREENRLVNALSGGYVPAGEGGMPAENGWRILPTGRNFYQMAVDKVPSQTAYERGKILAQQVLEAYQADEGRYPWKIAMNMLSTDISRTNGQQLSQFLYLLGVTPAWDAHGRVVGLNPIPLPELGRPRIDVTLRISGVMRDTWPGAVALMDEAVILVAGLEESDDENYVRRSIHLDEAETDGLGSREKTIRIFGDPPGAYGAGIDLALKASAWKDDRDLARYFIQASSYAYGKDLHGRKSIREFIRNAKSVDMSCDTSSSCRSDTLSCGFGVQVQGGFRLLAKAVGGKEIRQYQSSGETGKEIKTQSLGIRVEEDIRQTLLNAAWLDNQIQEGYIGAAEVMKRMQTVFEAKCTTDCIRDKTLDDLAEQYVNNEELLQWLRESNPHAAEEIARRLLELESRGRWNPDAAVLEHLRENYVTLEGDLEDGAGSGGEIQGGSVEIVGDETVDIWRRSLSEIDEVLRQAERPNRPVPKEEKGRSKFND